PKVEGSMPSRPVAAWRLLDAAVLERCGGLALKRTPVGEAPRIPAAHRTAEWTDRHGAVATFGTAELTSGRTCHRRERLELILERDGRLLRGFFDWHLRLLASRTGG